MRIKKLILVLFAVSVLACLTCGQTSNVKVSKAPPSSGQTSNVKVSKAPPSSGTIYFQDDWSSGQWKIKANGGLWDSITKASDSHVAPTVSNTVYYSAPYSGLLHYDMTYFTKWPYSEEGAGVMYFDAAHGYTDPIEHLFVRTRFLLHDTVNPPSGLGRKLYYLSALDLNDWRFVIAIGQDQKLNAGAGGTNCAPSWAISKYMDQPPLVFEQDTWYSVKFELNLLGVDQDVLRIWVNGTPYVDLTQLNIRGTCQGSKPLWQVKVGEQCTVYNGESFDEYRYVADCVMAGYDPGD